MRIESFLVRKHQQHPELSLRGNEERAESIGYVVVDKFFELIARSRVARTPAKKKLGSVLIRYTEPRVYNLQKIQ